MDNKFFLAMVWILCAAVVASLAYGLGDGLKWLARRLAAGWLFFCYGFCGCLRNARKRTELGAHQIPVMLGR